MSRADELRAFREKYGMADPHQSRRYALCYTTPRTAPDTYLQQELRELHAMSEKEDLADERIAALEAEVAYREVPRADQPE